jgi:hypothetical protein
MNALATAAPTTGQGYARIIGPVTESIWIPMDTTAVISIGVQPPHFAQGAAAAALFFITNNHSVRRRTDIFFNLPWVIST